MKTFDGLAELAAAAGTDLGKSGWTPIDQATIDAFASATGDSQWIHTDPVRAADGPFGTTIAHGMLTLSLMPVLLHEVYEVRNVGMAVNYGFDKVRFMSPVPVDSRIRVAASIAGATQLEGAVQVTFSGTVELEGSDKPAAVAQFIARFVA